MKDNDMHTSVEEVVIKKLTVVKQYASENNVIWKTATIKVNNIKGTIIFALRKLNILNCNIRTTKPKKTQRKNIIPIKKWLVQGTEVRDEGVI